MNEILEEKLKTLRPAWLEVDLDRVAHNVKLFKELAGNRKLIAAVKANMYGIGIQQTAKTISDAGADEFAVANIDEAIELRNIGIEKPILILSWTPPEEYELLLKYDIRANIFDLNEAKILSKTALKMNKKATIHVSIDTGMTRVGFYPDEKSVAEIVEISKLEGIYLEGIFSHLVSSEEEEDIKTPEQAQKFEWIVKKLEEKGIKIPMKHITNTVGSYRYENLRYDAIRVGYGIVGMFTDHAGRKVPMDLRQVSQLKAKIARILEVPEGTGIGYDSTYVTKKSTKIATIPLGYADGLDKKFSNNGKVLVNGKFAEIRGKICMDQFMIDVTEVDCKVGDEVIIYGFEEGAPSLYDISIISGVDAEELIAGTTRRVPIVYFKDNEPVEVLNYILDYERMIKLKFLDI